MREKYFLKKLIACTSHDVMQFISANSSLGKIVLWAVLRIRV